MRTYPGYLFVLQNDLNVLRTAQLRYPKQLEEEALVRLHYLGWDWWIYHTYSATHHDVPVEKHHQSQSGVAVHSSSTSEWQSPQCNLGLVPRLYVDRLKECPPDGHLTWYTRSSIWVVLAVLRPGLKYSGRIVPSSPTHSYSGSKEDL